MTMIKAFFRFKKEPFAKDIDHKHIFISGSMKEVFSRLDYMKQNRGLMLLTGEPGTGKTLAIRTFIEKLNPNFYFLVYIPLTTVSTAEFYRQLCFKLTGESHARKSTCFDKIQHGIIDLVKNNKKVPIIIIDESHLLKAENLFEIQIILNFDLDSTDPVLFIMIGQTCLRDILSRPAHKSLNQRFSLKYTFQPLEKQEIKNYIIHHFKVAGRQDNVFDDAAMEAIYQNTAGNPRDIGNLAIKALTLAAIEKKQIITQEEIFRASKEM